MPYSGSPQHPTSFEEGPVQLAEGRVEVADDYTKRKNVFRVRTDAGSEYLFQTEGEAAMYEWVTAIEDTALAIVVDERRDGGLAVAGAVGGTASAQMKKLASFRNRSPSAHSPATKARKASTGEHSN
jgi:hypothetical protein